MSTEADLQFAMQGIGRHCHELCNCETSEKDEIETYLEMHKEIAKGIYCERNKENIPVLLDHYIQAEVMVDRRKRLC